MNSAAAMQSLLADRLGVPYDVLWSDSGKTLNGEALSKAILDVPGLMPALRQSLERDVPGCHTQHLFTKEC